MTTDCRFTDPAIARARSSKQAVSRKQSSCECGMAPMGFRTCASSRQRSRPGRTAPSHETEVAMFDYSRQGNHSGGLGFCLLKVRSFFCELYALEDEAIASWKKSRLCQFLRMMSTKNGVPHSRQCQLN